MDVPLTIADFAYRAGTVFSDRLAVVDEPGVPGALGRLTFGELLARVSGMARALDDLGVAAGDRVAYLGPNAAKFIISLFAVAGTGRILVPVNYRLGAREVAEIVADCGARVLLVAPELAERCAGIAVDHLIVLDGEADADLFAPSDADVAWADDDEERVATINYSSGTTSTPKGVMLTHRNHWLNATALGWELGVGAGDVYLNTLPQFHVNGWGLPLATAAMGVANVIQRDVVGDAILERVEQEGVTLLCGAAPVVATIGDAAARLRDAGRPIPGAGRVRMVSGGAATPAAIIERFEQLTGWELIHAYGLTECAPVLTVNRAGPEWGEHASAERSERLTLAGAPLVGVRLRVDADGEIFARSAKVFQGYWGRPDLTDAAIVDGWFATGDGGTFTDGQLQITDRKKDVIVSGGENISSLEVEACLYQHPDVRDAAVIAIPHGRWGETPRAYVVAADAGAPPAPEALTAFCREHLAHFKCPTSFVFVDDLPRTATGKVQKYRLREDA